MSKISVCLATYNEEKNIGRCLESVKELADEIIVVDGTSTDRTVEIAKKYNSKIFIRENPLMFHKNKQFAFEKATGDWILYLDADEIVSPPLVKELKEKINENKYDGFWIPRKNIIFGKWIKHTGWWPDYQLRFFRKGKAYLSCKSVHEQPVLKGKTGYLRNPLVHYNYQTISQFIDKLNRLYTENDKNVFLSQNKKFLWHDIIRQPTGEFLKRFFKEKGYQDGIHGLILSLFQAFSLLITFAKIWENKNFPSINEENFLENVEQEFRALHKEIQYWFLTSKINMTRNFFKKFYHKFIRRIIR